MVFNKMAKVDEIFEADNNSPGALRMLTDEQEAKSKANPQKQEEFKQEFGDGTLNVDFVINL